MYLPLQSQQPLSATISSAHAPTPLQDVIGQLVVFHVGVDTAFPFKKKKKITSLLVKAHHNSLT